MPTLLMFQEVVLFNEHFQQNYSRTCTKHSLFSFDLFLIKYTVTTRRHVLVLLRFVLIYCQSCMLYWINFGVNFFSSSGLIPEFILIHLSFKWKLNEYFIYIKRYKILNYDFIVLSAYCHSLIPSTVQLEQWWRTF